MKTSFVRIFGLDIGYSSCGWAIVTCSNDLTSISAEDYGTITTNKFKALNERFNEVKEDVRKIMERYRPDVVALEKIFFFKNRKTAIDVAQVRGAVVSVLVEYGLQPYEYTPLQIKQSVTGYGRAAKGEIQKYVMRLYNLIEVPKPDDAADALAVAYCHASNLKLLKIFKNDK
ncbi:crossover junction endodeoxyribonuclease RuvC [Candidatus Dojkabacteria bacterium]|uniref:Crossover junction endodeoxyribonuclease RuvC n=1 Tax=Candidatus Dojkabacteria bacterium TaxID=2099670 RepID=A0A3M0Z2E3_9BACT|nr:MAG: crossover junction endodeoxyribonuclease RuvC [Candidatus Dojkabacteria bacterium]